MIPATPTLPRRSLLGMGVGIGVGLTLASAAAPLFVRHARAADAQRFALGLASGQPHAQGMVLWTMLSGAGLTAQVPVQCEGFVFGQLPGHVHLRRQSGA